MLCIIIASINKISLNHTELNFKGVFNGESINKIVIKDFLAEGYKLGDLLVAKVLVEKCVKPTLFVVFKEAKSFDNFYIYNS